MLAVLLIAGCTAAVDAPPAAPPAPPAAPAVAEEPPSLALQAPPPAPPAPRPAAAPLAAGQTVEIPAGVLRAGSMPGTVGRDPGSEADLIEVEVPAFAIDRLPYPNDPTVAPR